LRRAFLRFRSVVDIATPAPAAPVAPAAAPATITATRDAANRGDFSAFDTAATASRRGTPLPTVDVKADAPAPAAPVAPVTPTEPAARRPPTNRPNRRIDASARTTSTTPSARPWTPRRPRCAKKSRACVAGSRPRRWNPRHRPRRRRPSGRPTRRIPTRRSSRTSTASVSTPPRWRCSSSTSANSPARRHRSSTQRQQQLQQEAEAFVTKMREAAPPTRNCCSKMPGRAEHGAAERVAEGHRAHLCERRRRSRLPGERSGRVAATPPRPPGRGHSHRAHGEHVRDARGTGPSRRAIERGCQRGAGSPPSARPAAPATPTPSPISAAQPPAPTLTSPGTSADPKSAALARGDFAAFDRLDTQDRIARRRSA
jgi:hypothetical protein